MTNLPKPILYNGFEVKENVTIKNRIEKLYFTEIYELSNGKYLYLFVNLDPNDVIDRTEKYNMVNLRIEEGSYVGVIVDTHTKNQVFVIRDDLTLAKGFECVAGMQELKIGEKVAVPYYR